MPANLTYVEAAPSTEGSHYALAHIRGAKVTGGQAVLVYGATGAIGSAAVQLLKSLDVTVTAVCGPNQLDMVKGLGADRVVDYTSEDFTKDDQRYDVVMDSVGKTSFSNAGRFSSRRESTFPRARPVRPESVSGPSRPAPARKRVKFPIPKHDQEMIEYFKELLESGRFKPVVDRTYPLSEIVEAYRYVETGQKIGNVVITVDHSA